MEFIHNISLFLKHLIDRVLIGQNCRIAQFVYKKTFRQFWPIILEPFAAALTFVLNHSRSGKNHIIAVISIIQGSVDPADCSCRGACFLCNIQICFLCSEHSCSVLLQINGLRLLSLIFCSYAILLYVVLLLSFCLINASPMILSY